MKDGLCVVLSRFNYSTNHHLTGVRGVQKDIGYLLIRKKAQNGNLEENISITYDIFGVKES